MSISAEERNRYLRETAIVLAREGFHTDRTDTGKLRVLLDGAPLCEVTKSGGITYRNEDIDEPERIDAKDRVYEIVRTTAEYMRQMETAPFLKADGLEDGYKVLADFNDIVLAGIQSKYGVQFVTWDWSFDHKGVCHGHYYTGLSLSPLTMTSWTRWSSRSARNTPPCRPAWTMRSSSSMSRRCRKLCGSIWTARLSLLPSLSALPNLPYPKRRVVSRSPWRSR